MFSSILDVLESAHLAFFWDDIQENTIHAVCAKVVIKIKAVVSSKGGHSKNVFINVVMKSSYHTSTKFQFLLTILRLENKDFYRTQELSAYFKQEFH